MDIFFELERLILVDKSKKIDAGLIDDAFNSNNSELKGIAYTAIASKKISSRIEPYLTFDDYFNYIENYFEHCVIHDPDGEWSESRYSICWGYANWINHCIKEGVEKAYLNKFQKHIAEIYKKNSDDVKLAIETGLLEHILNTRKAVNLFSDWKKDDEMGQVLKRCSKA